MNTVFLFYKQKTASEMRISDWSSDVCSSDLVSRRRARSSLAIDDVACNRQHADLAAIGGLVGLHVVFEVDGGEIPGLVVRRIARNLGHPRAEGRFVAHPVAQPRANGRLRQIAAQARLIAHIGRQPRPGPRLGPFLSPILPPGVPPSLIGT